jgi:hypothetical protein
MKKKLNLNQLVVNSFITNEQVGIRGGKTTVIVYTDECKYSDWCIEQ